MESGKATAAKPTANLRDAVTSDNEGEWSSDLALFRPPLFFTRLAALPSPLSLGRPSFVLCASRSHKCRINIITPSRHSPTPTLLRFRKHDILQAALCTATQDGDNFIRTQSAMARGQGPEGLFDLPLELREMVYSNILPESRTIVYPQPEQSHHEKTISAVYTAHPILKKELESTMYKTCGARLIITPDLAADIPSNIEWSRFRRIDIDINRLRDPELLTSAGALWKYLKGMQQAIDSLRHGNPTLLPDIEIQFMGEEELEGESSWYQTVPARIAYHSAPGWDLGMVKLKNHYCTCGILYSREDGTCPICAPDSSDRPDGKDVWLQTMPNQFWDAVAVVILDFFLDLPRCKSTFVFNLELLQPRRAFLPRHHYVNRIFDYDYMADMCNTLEAWLDGRLRWMGLSSKREENGRLALELLACKRYGYEQADAEEL